MWDLFSASFWPKDFFSGAKWTDVLLTFFTLGLVLVGYAQAKVLRRQTKIAKETRDIALEGLGRPYVFFEFISHNLDSWREGEVEMSFTFRIKNFGISPAVIEGIFGYAFFSRGRGFLDDEESNVVREFPDANSVACAMVASGEVRDAGDDRKEWKHGRPLTLPSQGESRALKVSVATAPIGKPDWDDHAAYLYAATKGGFPVAPWLIARVQYENFAGVPYLTAICLRGHGGGEATEEYGHTYNQRT